MEKKNTPAVLHNDFTHMQGEEQNKTKQNTRIIKREFYCMFASFCSCLQREMDLRISYEAEFSICSRAEVIRIPSF